MVKVKIIMLMYKADKNVNKTILKFEKCTQDT